MINRIFNITIFVFILSLVLPSCSIQKGSISTPVEDITMWVASTSSTKEFLEGEASNSALHRYIVHKVSMQDKAPDGFDGELMGSTFNWKELDGYISGFDAYEEGHIYKVKVALMGSQMIKDTKGNSFNVKNYKLKEVISKSADWDYQKEEMVTVWLAPFIKKSEIHTVPSGELVNVEQHLALYRDDVTPNTPADQWQAFHDFGYSLLERYEEGYIFKISYTKVYDSLIEAQYQPTDGAHPGFVIKNIKILEKRAGK